MRPWFFQDAEGWVIQLKYGARVVPLDADNNAVVAQSLEDVSAVLDIFAKAVSAGELDTISSGFSRFPAIADPPICGTKLSQLVDHLQGAIP